MSILLVTRGLLRLGQLHNTGMVAAVNLFVVYLTFSKKIMTDSDTRHNLFYISHIHVSTQRYVTNAGTQLLKVHSKQQASKERHVLRQILYRFNQFI